MVSKESPPRWACASGPSGPHVFRDRPMRESDSKLESQLIGNSSGSPGAILALHATNELDRFFGNWRTSRVLPRFGFPVLPECLSLPADQSSRLDNEECRSPVKEPAGQGHDQTVEWRRPPRTSSTSLEKLDLVAEELILGDQPGSYSQSEREKRYQGHQK